MFDVGHFDREVLGPMYTKLQDNFQANKVDIPMWYEPGQLPDWLTIRLAGIQLVSKIRPLGFETNPGGEMPSSMHVLNDHTYCC